MTKQEMLQLKMTATRVRMGIILSLIHISIDRIRKGQGITTAKLDDFCQIFHCRVEDLITYVEPADGEPHSPYSEKSPK